MVVRLNGVEEDIYKGTLEDGWDKILVTGVYRVPVGL